MKKKKIVITGGHLTPALALIHELKKHDWEIVYFGRKKAMQRDKQVSLESKLIPEMGIQFVSIFTGRFRRHIDLENIISMCKIPVGILHSMYWLMKVKPNVVISFGGYLGLPAVIAAWFLRIPSVIHEQPIVQGLANKLSAPFATRIAVSFPSSAQFYPESKVVLTGNPFQPNLLKVDKKALKKYTKSFKNSKTIYVTTGNQGAKTINKLILDGLPSLLKKYNIVHQIGTTEAQNVEWERAQDMIKTLPKDLVGNYYPARFIDYKEVGAVFSFADLVISRGGANTIYDLGVLRKPSIIIPIEPSLMDEQLRNAELLEKSGLGKLVHQKNLQAATLINEIEKMFNNLDKFKLKKEYEGVFVKDSAKALYKTIEKMV